MNSSSPDRAMDAAFAATPDEANRIRELTRQRRHLEALAAARALATAQPAHRDALYLLAANQRCLGQVEEALETLSRLQRAHPGFGRLYQERGYCFFALRDSADAIAAFQQAVALNPALSASWNALQKLYGLIGDRTSAGSAAEQLTALGRLPAEVVQAGSSFCEGDFGAAETLARDYLLKDDRHAEALRILARIEQQREGLHQAERLFGLVLDIAPDYHAARLELARVLVGRQKFVEARAEIATLLGVDRRNTEYRSLEATACAGLGDHRAAISIYRELLDESAPPPHLHLLLGHSLKALGYRDEAIQSYRAALAARPDFGDAYWSLANLKIHRFSESEIGQMRLAAGAPGTREADRLHLHFALGSALESSGRFEESWSQYQLGNAMKRAFGRYRPEYSEYDTGRQIAFCTSRFFADHVGVGASDPDPIFIVGLPRSGSTLVEQILASHSQIEGTQELNVVPRIVQELQGRSAPEDPAYPGVLLDMTREQFRRLGERYLAETRAFRTALPARPFFIDKLPNNFRHVGLIHLMLPNAKIIDARRAPMDCCFSNLKQLFAAGHEFSYDLEFIARYYRSYLRLMRHWDKALPRRVHRVLHEDLVEDLQGSVHRLLDFCGLAFERSCVDFHKTARAISTPSSEQVRQPINRDGLDSWVNYGRWLAPLQEMLGDALRDYRD
jgi:tetratricopeptide (TPR) repeat protein